MVRRLLAIAAAWMTVCGIASAEGVPAREAILSQDSKWALALTYGDADWFNEEVWVLRGPDRAVRVVAIGAADRVLDGRLARDGSIEARARR
jgi:hypothetical protein